MLTIAMVVYGVQIAVTVAMLYFLTVGDGPD